MTISDDWALTHAGEGVPAASVFGGVPDPTVEATLGSGGVGAHAIPYGRPPEAGDVCRGKTKTGRDCRNPPADGENYCRPHILLMNEKYSPANDRK